MRFVFSSSPMIRWRAAVWLICCRLKKKSISPDKARPASVCQETSSARRRRGAVLWDLGWHPENAFDFLRHFPPNGPPIVALLPDETHAHETRHESLRGLLLREAEAESIVAALRAASQGLMVFDPVFADTVLRSRSKLERAATEALTPREIEVLHLLTEGLPNKIIAHRLRISEHTVKFHINSLMGKLGAQSRTDAVVRATRLGLIFL